MSTRSESPPTPSPATVNPRVTTGGDTATSAPGDRLRSRFRSSARNVGDLIRGLAPVTQAGVLGAIGPGALPKAATSLYRWDFMPSGLLGLAAARDPHHTAVIDDGGSVTYTELNDNADLFGGEIVGTIVESEAFDYLDAPVVRLGGKDVPIPYNPQLERAAVPQEEDIVAACRNLMRQSPRWRARA